MYQKGLILTLLTFEFIFSFSKKSKEKKNSAAPIENELNEDDSVVLKYVFLLVFFFQKIFAYNLRTLVGKECLKEKLWSFMGRERGFLVLFALSLFTDIITSNYY